MIATTSALLSGCSFFETPFSLSLEPVDEKPGDVSAVITIADPQVYARETLINDRRAEINFLTAEIAKVDNNQVTFTPQIARDISTLSALRVALGIAVDPLSGQRTGMQTQRDDLAQERELLQLQQEIEYEKQKLDRLRAQTLDGPPASSGNEPTAPVPGAVDAQKLMASMADLRTQLRDLLAPLPNGTVRTVAQNVAPLDEFRDKQAYRAELRAALQSVNLDDLHDFGGNTLYRLQFLATLFPGERKSKYGAAELTLEPPVLTPNEVAGIFYSWVGHAAVKMNPTIDDDDTGPEPLETLADYYRLIGPQTGLYSTFCVTKKNNENGFCLPVSPELPSSEVDNAYVAYMKDLSVERKGIGCGSDPLITTVQMIDAALLQLDVNALSAKSPSFKAFLKNHTENRNERLARRKSCTDELIGIPHPFQESILDSACMNQRCTLRGEGYAYATTPIEAGQRVSTTASAAQSFELALAASANLAQAGVDARGALNLARASSGNVDAIERLPLTIGYSARREDGPEDAGRDPKNKPRFGWVFGPSVRVDAERNQLSLTQIPRAQTLTADLSVPTWWPRAVFSARTAWIGNWHDGDTVFSAKDDTPDSSGHVPLSAKRFLVTLPRKDADLELLTSHLVKGVDLMGAVVRKPSIDKVKPHVLSACATTATFVIKGANIWRSTEVYLGNVRADDKDIKVLPDMEGVSVAFDVNKLFTTREPQGQQQQRPDNPNTATIATTGPASTKVEVTLPAGQPQQASSGQGAGVGDPKRDEQDKAKAAPRSFFGVDVRSNQYERVRLTVATRSGTSDFWVYLTSGSEAEANCNKRWLVAPDLSWTEVSGMKTRANADVLEQKKRDAEKERDARKERAAQRQKETVRQGSGGAQTTPRVAPQSTTPPTR